MIKEFSKDTAVCVGNLATPLLYVNFPVSLYVSFVTYWFYWANLSALFVGDSIYFFQTFIDIFDCEGDFSAYHVNVWVVNYY